MGKQNVQAEKVYYYIRFKFFFWVTAFLTAIFEMLRLSRKLKILDHKGNIANTISQLLLNPDLSKFKHLVPQEVRSFTVKPIILVK